MKAAEVKEIISERVDKVLLLAASADKEPDLPLLLALKAELKFIRNFMEFVRLQRNDNVMLFPDRCKKIYQVVSALILVSEEQDSERDNRQEKLLAEWKRYYSSTSLQRLKKELTEYDYGKIHPQLLKNFFGRNTAKRTEV